MLKPRMPIRGQTFGPLTAEPAWLSGLLFGNQGRLICGTRLDRLHPMVVKNKINLIFPG
jgi:hypothetical protein